MEYIPVEAEGPVKQREASWLQGGDDEESEENVDWVDKVQETYFVMVNSTRQSIFKGKEAYNCYGNYNNSFLILHYGFCFQNNLYDSVKFNVTMPKKEIISAKDLISEYQGSMQEIILKRDQVCFILLSFIRSCYLESFTKTGGKLDMTGALTKV